MNYSGNEYKNLNVYSKAFDIINHTKLLINLNNRFEYNFNRKFSQNKTSTNRFINASVSRSDNVAQKRRFHIANDDWCRAEDFRAKDENKARFEAPINHSSFIALL